MIKIDIKSAAGQKIGQAELPAEIFDSPVQESGLHAVVVAQLADKRRGTHASRNRALIHGGGRKPWKQKGTGRARAGSRRSPIWRGGATTFGPHPRDYSMKVNRKVKRQAMKSALTLKVKENRLHVLRSLEIGEYKTRKAIALLKAIGAETTALIVADEANPFVTRSFANLQGCKVLHVDGLNVYDVLRHEHLILTEKALEKVQARLAAAVR